MKTDKRNLTLNVMQKTLQEHIGMTITMLFVILVVVLLSLIPPQLLKIVIDEHLAVHELEGLLPLAIWYLVVLVLIGLFDFVKGMLLTVFGQKIVRFIRQEMALKLERLPIGYFTRNSSGSISSRFNNDVENISSLFTEGLASMMIDCLKIIGILISIAVLSWRLEILAIGLIIIVAIVTRYFQKGMLKSQMKNLEQLGKVNTHIEESLKNIRMIKSYFKEKYMQKIFAERLSDNYSTMNQVNFYDSAYPPIIQVLRDIMIIIIVLLVSGNLKESWLTLNISLGMVAASIELMSNLFKPIETLGMELQNIQQGLSGIRRVNEFYCEQEEAAKLENLTCRELFGENHQVTLSFENVCFSYEEKNPILLNFNLEVRPKDSITFVGRTGAGKSTTFKLIMGLLRPTSGRICLNGVDVYQIPNYLKRQIFGYVEQDIHFVKGSIADQITMHIENGKGTVDISRKRLEEVMKFVGLHEYVISLENGYDTDISNHPERVFSQGQKQLLAIARALATDPPVLLLDEMTANLDSVTEEQIVHILQETGRDRTILSISHRMSSVLNGNQIVSI